MVFVIPLVQGKLFLYMFYLGPIALAFTLCDLTRKVFLSWLGLSLAVAWTGVFGSVGLLICTKGGIFTGLASANEGNNWLEVAVYGMMSIVIMGASFAMAVYIFGAIGSGLQAIAPRGVISSITNAVVGAISGGGSSTTVVGGGTAVSGGGSGGGTTVVSGGGDSGGGSGGGTTVVSGGSSVFGGGVVVVPGGGGYGDGYGGYASGDASGGANRSSVPRGALQSFEEDAVYQNQTAQSSHTVEDNRTETNVNKGEGTVNYSNVNVTSVSAQEGSLMSRGTAGGNSDGGTV
jgi:hypothetical protein